MGMEMWDASMGFLPPSDDVSLWERFGDTESCRDKDPVPDLLGCSEREDDKDEVVTLDKLCSFCDADAAGGRSFGVTEEDEEGPLCPSAATLECPPTGDCPNDEDNDGTTWIL